MIFESIDDVVWDDEPLLVHAKVVNIYADRNRSFGLTVGLEFKGSGFYLLSFTSKAKIILRTLEVDDCYVLKIKLIEDGEDRFEVLNVLYNTTKKRVMNVIGNS